MVRLGRRFIWVAVLAVAGAVVAMAGAGALHAEPAPQPDSRIINGRPVGDDRFHARWRFIVGIREAGVGGPYRCAGSMIDQRTVLTSARCVEGMDVGDIRIYSGWRRDALSTTASSVRKVVVHSSYKPGGVRNDIAILVAASSSIRAPGILPARRAERALWGHGNGRAVRNDGTGPWIAGWGDIEPGAGTGVSVLREARVPIRANVKCGRTAAPGLGKRFRVPTMVCAGIPGDGTVDGGGVGICDGDIGGPLIVGVPSRGPSKPVVMDMRLVGIASWGYGCGGRRYDAYTRVSAYTRWIARHRALSEVDGVRVTKRTATALRVAWNRSSGARRYTLRIRGPEGWTARRVSVPTVTLRNRRPGYLYRYFITANDGSGETFGLRRYSVRTRPDTVRPKPVRNVRIKNRGYTSVRVNWDASADNDRLRRYDVMLRTTPRGRWKPWRTVRPNRTYATVTGIVRDQRYWVTIVAVDRSGNRSHVVDSQYVFTV